MEREREEAIERGAFKVMVATGMLRATYLNTHTPHMGMAQKPNSCSRAANSSMGLSRMLLACPPGPPHWSFPSLQSFKATLLN